MATVTAFTNTGEKRESAARLPKAVFGVEPKPELIGLAYRAQLAGERHARPMTLTRGLVRGGGKKPHRQKGTGRARLGSIRVPQAKGGGIVFGPTGLENHTVRMNIKVKRAALRSALSVKAQAGAISVIENFDGGQGKVKETAALVKKLGITGSILLAVAEKTPMIERATRNLEGLTVVNAKYLGVVSIMNADHIILTADGLKAVDAWLGEKE